jgi:hypothetical protein
MPTIKQKIAVNKILENRGNIGKAMREAGYAENTADNPKNLTESDGYKEIAEPIVKQMEKERQRAIKALSLKNLDDVTYEKISDVIDKLTKNIQLLSGGDTERIRFTPIYGGQSNIQGQPSDQKDILSNEENQGSSRGDECEQDYFNSDLVD